VKFVIGQANCLSSETVCFWIGFIRLELSDSDYSSNFAYPPHILESMCLDQQQYLDVFEHKLVVSPIIHQKTKTVRRGNVTVTNDDEVANAWMH